MNDRPDLTPEQRFQAVVEHTAEVIGRWLADTREALQPFRKALERLARDPELPDRLRRRAEEDRAMVTLACDCQCAILHPDARVCDLKAVTTIRCAHKTGTIDIPVCAPCAAEVMAKPQ
jgi:hypothetical protein